MALKVTLKDNSKIVLSTLEGNKKAALTAMATTAQGLILKQMESGYGKPIRQTGDLMRDVDYDVEGDKARVGNTLSYSTFVHEGTSRMPGRPYIPDGLAGEEDTLKAAASAPLAKGF